MGQDIFGQGFFATIVSWGIAIVVAVAFAVISYFWYYAAVTLAVGVLGYTLGVGFMAWLGIGDGFLAILLGLVVGGLFAAAAFVLGVPAWLVVIVSAISGAAAVVDGVLIFLGRVQLEDLQDGLLGGLLTDSFIGIAATAVIAAIAIAYQIRGVARFANAIDRSGYQF